MNKSNAAFTPSDFDDQERNVCENTFPNLKLKFLACYMKQAFYPLYKQNISRVWQQESTFFKLSDRYRVVKPDV